MKVNGYLVTTTDLNCMCNAIGGSMPANDNFCRTKQFISSTYIVDTNAVPYVNYTNSRYPRYQDVIPTCPTCSFAYQLGTTFNCTSTTGSLTVTVNSSCNNSEARLTAVGNGATTTVWKPVVVGQTGLQFDLLTFGTYKIEIRYRGTSCTPLCASTFGTNFNFCCNNNPNWVNQGSEYCDGCAIKQVQIDTNFCSSTYNTTRIVTITSSSANCGTWGPATQYCSNNGVYPFELRSKETNTCGQIRNDYQVATLSPTCGYTCAYWGLSVSISSYYCSNNTNGSGVVTVNANANNGGFQVRLVSAGTGTTTAWQSGTTFTGVVDGVYYAEIRSTGDNSCTASTSYPYQIVDCCPNNANWVNNGSAFCSGCNLYQPQIDQSCSSTGGQTRNLDLGTSDACGTWSASTQYCSGCDLRSREVNSCTGNVRNDVLVQSNSSACGTWNGQNYCINGDKWYREVNSCSGATRNEQFIESNSQFCCSQYTLSVNYSSQYCSGTNYCNAVVSLNTASTGGASVRLVAVSGGTTTGWVTQTGFTTTIYGVCAGYYRAEIRSAVSAGCVTSSTSYFTVNECYVPPTTTTTTTPCTQVTYYSLAACSSGVGNAYTTIAPSGTGQRYVLPFPSTTYYTYTGNTVSSCTPPSGYNSSIQIVSGQFGCP